MKSFDFEYTDSNNLLKLLSLSMALMLGIFLIFSCIPVVKDTLFGILLALALPITLLVLGNKQTKRYGKAHFHEHTLSLALPRKKQLIDFHQLESYKIERHHGIYLTFQLRDELNNRYKVRLASNNPSGGSEQFEAFTSYLEEAISRFSAHPEGHLIKKQSPVLGSFQTLMGMIALSTSLFGISTYTHCTGGEIAAPIWISMGLLTIGWGTFWRTNFA